MSALLADFSSENKHNILLIFIVAPCILITHKFLSPTNAPLYYTYKMLKYTFKISHDCSYMFRSTWTIIKEPMLNLAEVTILCSVVYSSIQSEVQARSVSWMLLLAEAGFVLG
jgi:hypothetical protein